MNLKTRILLGYGFLVALLVVSAAGAALGFFQLGDDLGSVLSNNYDSIRAAMAMLEAMERQDSAVLAALLEEDGAEALGSSAESFRQALEEARSNITEEREEAVIADIVTSFAAFEQARDELLAAAPERPLAAYRRETFPRFEAVKGNVRRLLDLNQEAMLQADRRALEAASRRAVLHGLLVTLAVVSLGVLSRLLQRDLLSRLERIKQVAQAIADGDLRRRADEGFEDELGLVARQLNAVLDQQQREERAMAVRNNERRRLLLGLVAALPTPAAVLSLGGELVASTLELAADRTAELTAAADRLRGGEPPAGEPFEEGVEIAGERLTYRLLRAGDERPVGWLVRPDP